jgi:hypothetical protein
MDDAVRVDLPRFDAHLIIWLAMTLCTRLMQKLSHGVFTPWFVPMCKKREEATRMIRVGTSDQNTNTSKERCPSPLAGRVREASR